MLLSVEDEKGRRLADDLDGFLCVDRSILNHIVNLNAEGSYSEEVEIPIGFNVRDGDAGMVLTKCWLLEGYVEEFGFE